MKPAISVLMPVRDAGRFLVPAIESILSQTMEDFELILIDDGSTDESPPTMLSYALCDERVRIITQEGAGIVAALNAGLAIARGDLIARMDADDISMPRRFEIQAAYLEQTPDCAVVGCGVLRVDPDNWPIALQPAFLAHEEIERRLFNGEGGALPHPAMMMRRHTLEQLDGYRREAELAEDIDLYLRAAELGRLANVPDILLRYRRHAASVSAVRRDEQWRVVQWILRDICARRGLPPPPLTRRHPIATPEGLRAHWVELAFKHGFPETAAKLLAAGDVSNLQLAVV